MILFFRQQNCNDDRNLTIPAWPSYSRRMAIASHLASPLGSVEKFPHEIDRNALEMDHVIVIPAREGGDRLPDKAMLVAGGRTLVERTYLAAKQCSYATFVCVATDSERIAEHCESRRIPVVVTSGKHDCGSSRVLQALEILQRSPKLKLQDGSLVANWQVDEPCLSHLDADLLFRWMSREKRYYIGSLVAPLRDGDADDPHTVKAWADSQPPGERPFPSPAIDFSREKRHNPLSAAMAHVGLYVFRADALADLGACCALRGPHHESLEQLKWLAHYPLMLVDIPDRPLSINTPRDFAELSLRVANHARRSYRPAIAARSNRRPI